MHCLLLDVHPLNMTTEPRARDDILGDLGWRPRPGLMPGFEAEATAGRGWTAGRLWTAGSMVHTPAANARELHVIVGVEGRGTITSRRRALVVGRRQLMIAEAEHEMRVESNTPWARFEWVLDSPALSLSRHLRLLTPIAVDELHWELIAAMTNTLVSHEPSLGGHPSSVSSGGIGAAFTQLLLTVLERAGSGRAIGSESSTGLIDRAYRLIDENFSDPEYGVADLRADLSLSKSHLHRLFADQGTTPRRELEARRVDAALVAMESTPSAEVARASGFRSVQRMMIAIGRRQAGGNDEGGQLPVDSARPL